MAGLFKQVLAVIDARTTVVCLHAAGQIQPPGEPYETLAGEFDVPPFHGHCRSISVPWMSGFGQDIRHEANAELQKRPLKERRIGPGGEVGGYIPPLQPPRPLVGYTEEEVAEAADELLVVANRVDDTLTSEVAGLVIDRGGVMAGLEFRIKSRSSLIRKLRGDVIDYQQSPRDAATHLTDVNRFTGVWDEAVYTEKSRQVIAALRRDGYKVKVKNYWGHKKNPYRGINLEVRSPDGVTFELQFHTAQSLEVKEGVMHHLYEQWRAATRQDVKNRLSAEMWKVAATIKQPRNVTRLIRKVSN